MEPEIKNLNSRPSRREPIFNTAKTAQNCPIIFNSRGITLVELIVSLFISLLVVAAASFILLTQSGVIRLNKSVSTEQQRLNVSFNTVRYYLSMAGFDYGQNYFIQNGAVPPVQIVNANYPANPYEVFAAFGSPITQGICSLTQVSGSPHSTSANFELSQDCNYKNFYIGELIMLFNVVPLGGGSSPIPESSSIVLCVTGLHTPNGNGTYQYGGVQTNPGNDQSCNNPLNPPPPGNINSAGTNSGTSITQELFYWYNNSPNSAPYAAPEIYDPNTGSTTVSNFNVPGNLYECQVVPLVTEPPAYGVSSYVPPKCLVNTVIVLSDYISAFSVAPSQNMNVVANYNDNSQYYSYDVIITGESNVALSNSPAYSIHVPYNPNSGGINAVGNAQQIVGNNVLKTLNSSVYLKNVYYKK